MNKSVRNAANKPFLLLLLFACIARPASAGESDQAQPYEKIRYPTFANGRLQSMLEADQAEAYDLSEGTPRINLKNVSITLYNHSEHHLKTVPDDQLLPVKMTIQSDRGYFTRRPPEPGGQPEEIANLEGNVVIRQMRDSNEPLRPSLRPKKLPPGVETEIRCQHAQWNNSLRKLNGDGEVEFVQENSRIVGTGFLYLADDEALDASTGSANIRDWGGIVFIEHNARMEIDRTTPGGGSSRTEITCRDTASYKLREREIQFERDVRISQPGLVIECDILKVFLYREEELAERAAKAQEPGQAGKLPGEVRSIVATIGKRGGSVVITGSDVDARGGETFLYTARGGRADFDFEANRLTLTDTRTNREPEVEFGENRDRISDRSLDFVFVQESLAAPAAGARANGGGKTRLNELNTAGGRGQVFLRPRPDGAGLNVSTEISYKGDMNYSRADNRIRFRESVYLKQGNFRIRSEMVEVRLNPETDPAEAARRAEAGLIGADQIDRIIAENEVTIQDGGREARAQRAEYEVHYVADPVNRNQKNNLYILHLYGPPQRTPPHPWVRDDMGNQITAPEIEMHRLERSGNSPVDNRDRHLIRAFGGVAVCDFFTDPRNPTDKGKVISIKCESGMQYNEVEQIARFDGQVMATSDAPEDNYVLTSDRLTINLPEVPNPAAAGETLIRLRRIDAEGNARLMQDTRTCEAVRIIRDFPSDDMSQGDIYLAGIPAQDGRPPLMAVYREQMGAELGAMFAAPLIKASAKGDLIQANGPGQLSTPDDLPGFRSEIHFDGGAQYQSLHGGIASEAKFWRGVHLRQPSRGLTVNSDELDARFLQERIPEEPKRDGDFNLDRIGALRRAEARGGVKVEYGSKNGKGESVGDRGVIEFTNTGNTISMEADRSQDRRRSVMARYSNGMVLRSADIEVREAQGITRASGPGEMQIPGDAGGEGMSKVPTRVQFGERGFMVYNELALNIKVSDNVRIIQPGAGNNWSFPSLDGHCDRMEIVLLEPPSVGGMSGQDALSRVLRMDAQGGVLLRVYADPPPDNPNIDWLSRPGTTFFTRGDFAEYDVPAGRIVISSLPGRQPQLLLNMVDVGSPPRRQRLRADRFVLHTNTMPRRWNFEGQLESNTLRDGEAFEFRD